MATSTKHSQRAIARQRQARRQKLVLTLVGVGVVLLAVLIAVFSAQESGSAVRVDDIAGAPEIDGSLEALPDPGVADPAIGSPAPAVTGADFTGSPVTIGTPGAPQLLMFVASWCPACQQELPIVVSWLDQGGLPGDVEFTTVVTWLDDARPNWPPDAWLEEENYTGRVLVDDAAGSVAAAYGQPGTPYWVAIDEDGQVVSRISGMLSVEQMAQLATAISTG